MPTSSASSTAVDNRQMRTVIVLVAILILGSGAAVLYVAGTSEPAGSDGTFSTGIAILVVGYLLWPVLALLAGGLLLIALLLAIASATERRRGNM